MFNPFVRRGRRQNRKLARSILTGVIESLEQRTLLSTVTVNAAATTGPVQTDLLGVNFATWDGLVSNNGNTATPTLQTTTQQDVAAAGLNTFRIPGGGTSDFFHFAIPGGGAAVNGASSIAAMAMLVSSVNGVGMVTVNYGTGSPQEGAAMLAYLNGTANSAALNAVNLGVAPIFLATSGTEPQTGTTGVSWTTYNWQTAGFWATLRSQTPAANPTNSDGLNFLRIGRTAPFGFHYFEVGNEIYGATVADGEFSADAHGLASFPASSLPMPAGTTPTFGDPTTYVAFAKEFQTLAMQIDPNISIGIDSQSVSKNDSNNWINNVFTQSVAQGFQPNFISDHIYPQGPGTESDSGLLSVGTTPQGGVVDGPSNTVNTYDLSQRAAVYRSLASFYFPGSNVPGSSGYIELLATEVNSVYSNPGKQSVSIVNGLFIEDAIGSMMDTESGGTSSTTGTDGYDGLWVWDLHNGPPSSSNSSASLYGWRTGYGDYGMLGVSGSKKGEGANVEYPDYFAEQLASKIVKAGGTVVSAASTSSLIDTYAVMESNGHLELLIVNKTVAPGTPPNNTPDPGVTNTFSLSGFTASGQATVYQYGVAEDDAQAKNSVTFASSLTTTTPTLSVTNGSFTLAVGDYTMMVVDLAPASAPTVQTAAAATPNPVNTTSTQLTATGASTDGTALTYTWSATGPAAVLYSGNANGTTSAAAITANFTTAGQYMFTVKIADSAGLFTTSNVTVNVNQTPTVVNVSPSSPTLAVGSIQQFTATATDQFGNAIASPPIAWSITGTGNSISTTGLATLGAAAGSYTVTAMDGSALGSTGVTTLAAPAVSSFTVNDGNAQRAMVTSLTVTFSEAVSLSSGAIALGMRPSGGGADTPETFTLSNPSGDQQTYVLTFTDPSDIGGSLPDGVYDLTVHAALVANAAGSTAAADQTYSFYRLYGDFFGTGAVGFADLVLVAQTFGDTPASAGYVPYVPLLGENSIGFAELVKLAQNFGVSESATNTNLTVSSSQAVLGQAVTLTATVTAIGAASATPTGTVTFLDGMNTIGSAPVNTSGTASISESTLFTGVHSLSAVYSGSDPTSTGQAALTISPPMYTTESGGLGVATVAQGSGNSVADGDYLEVNYTGYLTDGTEFDSSLNPGRTPFEFLLGNGEVIGGWDEGIVGMEVGETRVLDIPPALAYGTSGQPQAGIPSNATLIFVVKLLATEPRLAVYGGPSGSVQVLLNGTPTTTNGTNFGNVAAGSNASSSFGLYLADQYDGSGELPGLGLDGNITLSDTTNFSLTTDTSNGFIITITFTPQTTGSFSCTVTIPTTDPAYPNFTFTVTGVGI